MASTRMRRIDGSIREVIAAAIADDVTDPGVGFVTVTSVQTSGDLRHAKVFVSIFGSPDEQSATLDALARARRLLQGRIAAEVQLKYTPVLEFVLDDSPERAARLDALLSEPRDAEDGA